MATEQEVADLLVRIEASTSLLRAELGKADQAVGQTQRKIQTSLSGIDKSFERLGGSLKGALLAAIPTVTIAGIAALAKQSLEAAGGLDELARQLGISTDLLQTLQFAGTQAGVSVEEINTGIARFTKTVGDASEGNKAAIERFNSLGVNILDAAGNLRSSDAILRDVADALQKIQDPARRAAAEVDLFGKSGQKLDTIFASGSDALRDFERAARDAGAVLTREQIDAADRAADKIAALEFQYAKLAQTVSVSLAPALTDLLGIVDDLLHDRPVPKWFELIFRANPAVNAIFTAKDLFDAGPIEDQLAAAGKRVEEFRADLAALENLPIGQVAQAEIDATKARLDAAIQAFNRLKALSQDASSLEKPGRGGVTVETLDVLGRGTNPTPAATGVDKVQKQAESLLFQIDQLGRSSREQAIWNALNQAGVDISSAEGQRIAALADTLYSLTAARAREKEMIEASTQAAVAEEQARAQADERAQRLIRQRQQVTTSIDQEIEDNKKLIAAKAVSNEAYEKEALFLDLVNRYRATGLPLTDDEIEKARGLADTLYEQQKALSDTNELANALGQTFSSAFEDAVVSGKSLSEVLQGLLQDLERIALRAATQPIFEAIFSGLSSLALAAFAGGGIMTPDGPVPLRRYAGGGIASSAQAAIFGEGATPEAFVPVPNGRIPVEIRASRAPANDNAGAIYISAPITVNGSAGTPAQNLDLANKMGAELERRMKIIAAQEIRAAIRPGGMLNPGN